MSGEPASPSAGTRNGRRPPYSDEAEKGVLGSVLLDAKILDLCIEQQLVPESFTLSEQQRVHERILGTPLDKRNFRKKIQALELLTPTGEERRDGPHRPAKLYRVKDPADVPYR